MSDAGGSDTTTIAWEHVYTTSPPELRRWLDNSKPVAMHQDALMVAVPNNFTRNQLEGRFRPDIEQQLSDYFQRVGAARRHRGRHGHPGAADPAALEPATERHQVRGIGLRSERRGRQRRPGRAGLDPRRYGRGPS